MNPFYRRLQIWREYTEISEAGQIARRAFANNSFDGVLTMVGVVMGIVGVAILVSNLVAAIFAAAPPPGGGLWTQLALSIGAGLYEELLFRVLLVGGLALLFRPFFQHPNAAYLLAAILGAALFSLVHYAGPLGDPFELPSFTFRFAFGLALNVLFLWRGFGVAAWTHALYDVMVVTGMFG